MDISVHTEIEIKADAARVWAALTETGKRSWDPIMRSFKATLAPGEKASIFLRLGWMALPIRGRLSRCDAPHELAWKGGVPGLMKAEHGFRIETIDETTVRFVHYEDFKGPLVFVIQKILRNLPVHYNRMNEAIKARSEEQCANKNAL